MKLHINGLTTEFDGATVADLLQQQQPQTPFAVAVNTVFVAKSAYADTLLHENDKVDIVRPVVGG